MCRLAAAGSSNAWRPITRASRRSVTARSRARRAKAPGSQAPLSPKLRGRELGAGRQGFELRPGDLWMNAAAEAAIGPGDDVLAADHFGVAHDAVRDHLRMLDDVGRMADHTGNEQLAVRQSHVLPDAPFMLVPGISRLDRIGTGIDAEHEIDDVG